MSALGLAGAVAVAGVALGGTVVAAALCYCAFYLLNGASWPLRKRFLHDRVEAGQRATVLSAMSLVLQLGGLASSLLVPRLAEALGLAAGLLVAAGLTVVLAGAALRLRAAEVPGGARPRP